MSEPIWGFFMDGLKYPIHWIRRSEFHGFVTKTVCE